MISYFIPEEGPFSQLQSLWATSFLSQVLISLWATSALKHLFSVLTRQWATSMPLSLSKLWVPLWWASLSYIFSQILLSWALRRFTHVLKQFGYQKGSNLRLQIFWHFSAYFICNAIWISNGKRGLPGSFSTKKRLKFCWLQQQIGWVSVCFVGLLLWYRAYVVPNWVISNDIVRKQPLDLFSASSWRRFNWSQVLTRNNIAHWQYWQSAAGRHTWSHMYNLIKPYQTVTWLTNCPGTNVLSPPQARP